MQHPWSPGAVAPRRKRFACAEFIYDLVTAGKDDGTGPIGATDLKWLQPARGRARGVCARGSSVSAALLCTIVELLFQSNNRQHRAPAESSQRQPLAAQLQG
ncbi:unnamed protein product [Chrysodeixis includens]|uniref:Uncharacterized protein n=1 Tax=Chrysodeixis includens TaxID=689277 RepID=A0A9N8KS30_CHRIL|nr:unnamed protein product [Chrysodeixis includens]